MGTALKPDLEVRDEGSIFLLRPLTDTGAAWIGENLASDDVQYFGDSLLCRASLHR